MDPTRRLYFNDWSTLDFTANVVDVRSCERGEEIALDQTAFYPTGGGQPNDTGVLGGATVIDVYEEAPGRIYHVVRETSSLRRGQTVQGIVARSRRIDHMQQHSGQHILSQAFVKSVGAETRSFHLGSESSTIDIELEAPSDAHMRAAELLANEIVFDDRPVRVHFVNEEQAAALPLRKESAVRGEIRVIEIEDFDWSPCGGTHAARSGQVGLIAIKSYERVKKMTRVEFVCGVRALREYNRANQTAVAVAQAFSADRNSAPDLVSKMLQENKSLKKRVRELLETALKAEAMERLATSHSHGGFKIVSAMFEGRDQEELRILAARVVLLEPAVVLLGTRDQASARLVFARSASVSLDMGRLLSGAAQTLGGRGGGKPDLAQGGGPQVDKLGDALAAAEKKIVEGFS